MRPDPLRMFLEFCGVQRKRAIPIGRYPEIRQIYIVIAKPRYGRCCVTSELPAKHHHIGVAGERGVFLTRRTAFGQMRSVVPIELIWSTMICIAACASVVS